MWTGLKRHGSSHPKFPARCEVIVQTYLCCYSDWTPATKRALGFLKLHCCAATDKLLQSCLTLRDPIDSSPPGSPVPGILQARTLEWVAISFSNAWKWKVKVKSLSKCPTLRDPMDCSLPGSSAHGIFQAGVLEWVAIAFFLKLHRPQQFRDAWVMLSCGNHHPWVRAVGRRVLEMPGDGCLLTALLPGTCVWGVGFFLKGEIWFLCRSGKAEVS